MSFESWDGGGLGWLMMHDEDGDDDGSVDWNAGAGDEL